MMVVDDPPLSHENYAVVTITPPIPDDQREHVLAEVVRIIQQDLHCEVLYSEIYPFGVGLVSVASPVIRDRLVRDSPHAYDEDEDTTFSLIRHDECLNMRVPVFEYEAWIMFLAFPLDYQTEHYVNKGVSCFGKLILWHNPGVRKSRVLVRVMINDIRLVPRSLLVKRIGVLGGVGRSWTVPVYILDGRHTNPTLVSTEEPAPAMNASPHPYELPFHTIAQQHNLQVQMWMQQNADHGWNQGEPAVVEVMENGGAPWPAVPPPFRGTSMRAVMQYDGPSMMDGVETADNIRDDAMEAWNEHVAEVELAAARFMTGNTHGLGLVFIRAGGENQFVDVPYFPTFMHFLRWMTSQVSTRCILPAGPSDSGRSLNVMGDMNSFSSVSGDHFLDGLAQGLGRLYEAVLWATNDLSLHLVQLDLDRFESHSAREFHSSVSLIEIEDTEHESIDVVAVEELDALLDEDTSDAAWMQGSGLTLGGASAEDEVHNSEINMLPPDDQVNSILDQVIAPVLNVGSSAVAPYAHDAASSSVDPAVQVAKRRGRPKKADTPLTVSVVRRSPRNHNDGRRHTALSDAPRRSSSVAAATPPAVLQVSELQRLGVEECHIAPEELTEERLR
jgi:hypothetical protein